MYSFYARRKSSPPVIILTILLVWSQLGFLASPAHAETAKPKSVSQEVYAFKDITPAQSDYIFINFLKKAGLISGFADGTFRPQSGLTRAEVATVLVKAAGLKTETAETGFKDVSAKHWAAKNIAAAKNAGLISGYPNGTFHPEAMLTRAEGITLVLKLSKQADSGVDLPTLADVPRKHWAARPIATGLAAEMVSLSKDNKRFLPDMRFNRGSLARALAILLTKDPELYQTVLPNVLTVTTGTVHVTRANSNTPEIINNNTVLNIGDSLIVDQASSAKLDFPDGTGLRLEQNSAMTIKGSKGRSYIKPDGSPGITVEALNVDMKRGQMFGALATSAEAEGAASQTASTRVRAASLVAHKTITTAAAAPLPWWKKAGVKRTKVKVDMPTGVAAIRGTFWENQVSTDGSFKTSLLTGDAEVTSSGGQNVSLIAGQRTEVTTTTAPPAPPAPLTVVDKKEWVQVATWAQQQSAAIAQNREKPLPPPPPVVPEAPKPPVPQPKPQQPPITQPPTPQPQPPQPPTPEPATPKNDITQIIFNALTDAGATNLTPPEKLIPPPPPPIILPPVLTPTPPPPPPAPPAPPSPPPATDNSGDSTPSIVPVTGVTLNQASLSLVAGQSPVTLTATVSPANTSYPTVTWTTSNPAVATLVYGAVNSQIKVAPVVAGTAAVTARTSNNLTATCYIKVAPSVPVSFLNLNATEIRLAVGGNPYILLPIIAPSNATNKSVTWSSSTPGIVDVVNGVVVPLSAGTTTITATTVDGNKQATCLVYVAP